MSVDALVYPHAELRPHAVAFGSVRYDDPLQWLEEETAEVAQWQQAQDDLARDWLASRPGQAHLAERLDRLEPKAEPVMPKHAGGRWFRAFTPPGCNLKAVEVAETPTGSGRVVIDLNAMTRGEPLSLDTWLPSPDGRKIIVAWGEGGRELQNFQVFDVDSGALLLPGIPQVRPFFAAWFHDSSGLYYQAYDAAVSMTEALVFRLVLGEAPPTVPEPIERSHPVIWPHRSIDGRHYFVCADHLDPRPDYIREEGGAWRPFLQGMPAQFRGDIVGDRYIAITNDGAPCGRLVSIPLATPQDRATWTELVPGSDAVLAAAVVIGDRIALLDLVDTYARLRVLGADGTLHGGIALPGRGVVNTLGGTFDMFSMVDSLYRGAAGDVVFLYCSPSVSPALYRANVDTLEIERLTEPAVTLDAKVIDGFARSADGARVPYHVVMRSDLDPTQPRPALIHGYGGFNAAFLPGWSGTAMAAWIEAGGVLVLTHLRGGGELGPDWWRQGRMEHKQNSFNDVFAIAEAVIASGVTTARQLGVFGGSNGGVMAAAVAVQRPDLFRASVPQVPITDVLARARDPITIAASLDYGDPHDEHMSRVIHAWSPYQNTHDDVAYPAVYFDTGLNDARCPPWHGRKMAARLQQASTSGRPVLLRVRAGAGHGAVGKAAQREQQLELLSFFADQLGLAA